MAKWLFSAIFLAWFCLSSCSGRQLKPGEGAFGFVLHYGVNAVNSLDTFRDTLAVAITRDSLVQIPFSLSPADMAKIQQELEKIDIWAYPDTLDPCASAEEQSWQTPFETIVLELQEGTRSRRIVWADRCGRDDARSRALRRVINHIRSLIVNHPRYRQIPRVREGYH